MASVARRGQRQRMPASATKDVTEPPAQPERRPYRGRHDGTTVFDQKRGKWRGAVRLEGKRYWFWGDTEAAVKRKIAAKRQEFYDWSLTEPNKLTVAQVVTEWLEQVIKKRRRLATYTQYETLVRLYVLPQLGKKRVRDLSGRQLERFYGELEDGTITPAYTLDNQGRPKTGRTRQGPGLAPKSIRGLHVALHAAFTRAVRHRQLPRNPADDVELPALPRPKRFTVTLEDVQRLLAVAQREYDALTSDTYPLWCFLANTGLRIGEALALRWANVDLANGWLTVEEDLAADRTIGEVKTAAGVRDLPMTPALKAALTAWQTRQAEYRRLLAEGYEEHDLVFATATGRPNHERNALRALVSACKRADVTPFALHDFRRMCASLLVASGVDIATAAAVMGHKNASVLLDVYAKALRGPKLAAAAKLQAALYPPKTPELPA